MNKLYVLVTWDEGMPLVRHYEDRTEAVEIYELALIGRDAAYLYETDESGSMTLILESERLGRP